MFHAFRKQRPGVLRRLEYGCRWRGEVGIAERADRHDAHVRSDLRLPIHRCSTGGAEIEANLSTRLSVPLENLSGAFDRDLFFRKGGAVAGQRPGPALACLAVTHIDQQRFACCCRTQGATVTLSKPFHQRSSARAAQPNSGMEPTNASSCRRLQVNGRKLPKIKSLASRIVCFGSGAAARPHWNGWLLSALLGRPVPAFHASRLRHIGSHPVGSAERLKPVQDGAVQASASPSAATPPSVGQKCQGTCGRSDWRIFEPLGGEFDLPIEWVLWE